MSPLEVVDKAEIAEKQVPLFGNPTVVAQNTASLVRLDPYGIPLHPTPTKDDLDPLNWPRHQKLTILFIVCFAAFLAMYLTTTTVASFFLLQQQFNASYSEVNWTLAIPAVGIAFGSLLFAPLADIWGRRPILVITSALTVLFTGCTTIQNIDYGGYMAVRFLQGLSGGPAVVIGFGVIRDISFEHERGFNTGLWVLSIDTGFILGAVVGGFTAATGPFWANYHVAIAYGVLFLLELFLLPETLYPRGLMLEMLASNEPLDDIRRTKNIRVWEFMKMPGIVHPQVLQGTATFLELWRQPRVAFALIPFIFMQYWWNLSVVTMAPAAYAEYSTQIQGLLFLGFAFGAVISELLCSGRLSDMICARLALRNNQLRTPEMRLWLVYLGVILGAVGPVLWGLSVDYGWHWMVDEVALFLLASGLQISSASITTYIFESFPDRVLEIIAFYIVVTNIAAFILPLFINYWVEAVGYTWCFVTQGLITVLLIPVYACLQRFGVRLPKGRDL